MTNFESLAPLFVALLLLGGGVSLFFALRAEHRLFCRQQIKLENYRQKNNLFYINRDIPTAVICGVVGLAALVMAIIYALMPVARLYAIPLAFVAAANGVAVYFSLSRRKYVRDIRVFDAYYVQVEYLLNNKEQTLYNMEVCRKRVKELYGKLSNTLAAFNRNLKQPIAPTFLAELFAPISKMVDEYMKEIDRFSVEIERDFDCALSLFLHEEVQPELRVVPLRDFDDTAIDDLLAEIKTTYGKEVAGIVIDQVEKGAITGAVALGNIMTLLHGLGVYVNEETLARFMRAAAVFSDRSGLATVLYNNKQIPVSMVLNVMIPEKWEWAFSEGMVASYNVRELQTILTELLRVNDATLCYLFLSQMDASHVSVLRAVMADPALFPLEGEFSQTAKQVKAFVLILDNEYAVGNTGSVFEALTMMLFDRYDELMLSDEERAMVVDIVEGEKFLEHRREIAALYARGVQLGKGLCESTTKILLYYMMEIPESEAIFDAKRLAAILGEYRFTLSFGDLSTLRTLLCGWMLCANIRPEAKNNVLKEIANVPAPIAPAEGTNAQNADVFGRALITYLVHNDRVRLRSAIYRTESTRLALDRILALCEKGD